MWSFQYKHGDRPLEGYTIQRAAGRGGFGEVYYALSDSGREVALKAVQGYEQIELRGISQCMNLKSPHLVSIFDVRHNDQGRPFVIMEFVNGPSLRQLLDEAPSGLGEQKSAFFLREMAKGLTFLHDCGIVHRDLKPGNVFYENGYVKIGDYGLSKSITAGQTSQQTVTVGTVHYMAPEIGGGNYDRSIDIYALGACLYEMITGTVPFIGASPSEILMKHLSAEPDCSGIPEPFCSAIKKAMHKDPTRRFQSVQEMVEAVFGAEHVRNSMSMFSPDELSVVAGKVAGRMAPPASPARPATPNSSSVVNDAKPVAGGNAWRRLNEREQAATFDLTPVPDPMPARDRWLLALLTSGVIAVAVSALASRRGGFPIEYGVQAFLACWGATLGLILGARWARNWGEPQRSHKLFLGGLALAGAILLSGGMSIAPMTRPIQTWIAIAIPLVLLNPIKWMTGQRDERVAIGAGFGAGLAALICSAIFQGSTFVAVGVVSGVAMMTQVLSPWQPTASRRSRGLDAAPKGAEDVNAPFATPPIAARSPRSPFFDGQPVPAIPAIASSSASGTAWTNARRTPIPFRIVMLILSGAALVAGLTCVIAFGTGAADGQEGPPTIAFGVSALVLSLAAFGRSRKRVMTSWWSLLVRPALQLLCVESIVFSSVFMGNLETLNNEERMIGTFFIVFPAVLFLILMMVPGTIRDDANTPAPDIDVHGELSPYKRLWALLLAGLGFVGFGGIHRIYVGKTGSGIVHLITFGWFWIGTIVDIVNICAGRFTDGSGRLLLQWEDELIGVAAAVTAPIAPPTRDWINDIRAQVTQAGGKIADASTKLSNASHRRALRQAVRKAKFKAVADANRPPRDFRVVTGGALSVLATLLILVSFIATAALVLDVPGFFAAGLPTAAVAKRIETEVFGYAEWPTLVRKLGALAVGITMVLGLAVTMFARRRAGFSHMGRGVIGATGLLFALMPISSNVRNDVTWGELSPAFQKHGLWFGVDETLSQLNRGSAPYVAGGLFLASVILLAWPERRTPAQRIVPMPMGGRASGYRAVAAAAPEASSSAGATAVSEPAKGA